MVKIGVTEGAHFLKSVKDGAVRIIKQVLNKSESKESIQTSYHGLDAIPPKNCNTVITTTEQNESIVVAIIDYLNKKTAKEGETRLYATSSDGKELLFDIYLKEDGTCVFADGESPSVAFDRLKEEFNELQEKFNKLVDDFNAHQHTYIPPIAGYTAPAISTTGSQSATKSQADIDNASSDTILIP